MKRAMKQSTLTLILNGISILTLIYMVYSLIAYSQVSGQLNTANEERFSLTYNANRFMNGSAYLTNEVRAFAATGDQQHYDNYWSEVNDLQNRDKGVAALQEIGITDEEQGMIDDMFALSNRLVPLEENAMEEVQAGNMAEAISYVYGTDYSESIAQINALKEQFLADLDQRSLTQVQELQARAEAIRMSMILALVMVGVIQMLNMIISRIMIMRPVLKVKEQMMEISQGNLSAEFSLESNTSEIGMLVASIHETKGELKKYIKEIDHTLAQMAQGNMNLTVGDDYRGEFLPIQDAMRQILDSLNQALSRIHLTAERVSEESERMASDAQTLSNGNVQQAAAVQQLSSSIHEISKQVDQTSRDADDAKQASEDASMQLRICDEKMTALTTAIKDISSSSNQIGGIIKTISDIAFQTKILALNASVEAARAGEAGKGFSVVADEVRNLAAKSAEAAQNTDALINHSIHDVKTGTASTDLAVSAMQVIGDCIQTIKSLMDEISASSVQQSEMIVSIENGIKEISKVVQANSSAAEESAQVSKELSGQARTLNGLLSRFRIR